MADRSVPESGKNRVALGEFDQAVEARPRLQRRRFPARQTTQGKALTGKEQSCPDAIGQIAGYAFGPSLPRINSCRPDGTSLQRQQDQAMGRSSCDTSRPRPPAIVPVSLCVPDRRRDSGTPGIFVQIVQLNLRRIRKHLKPTPRRLPLVALLSSSQLARVPTSYIESMLLRCGENPAIESASRWKTTPWSCS